MEDLTIYLGWERHPHVGLLCFLQLKHGRILKACVQLIKDNYIVVTIPQHNYQLAYAPTKMVRLDYLSFYPEPVQSDFFSCGSFVESLVNFTVPRPYFTL